MAKKKEVKKEDVGQVSIESQMRLAEILTDSPRLVSLNGTEWEVKALRMGTQWLIAKKCVEINKADSASMGDVIKQFSTNMPAILDVITLALLNDKDKIFKDGVDGGEFSELYKTTRETLEWECNVGEFADILFEVLQMLDSNFFYQALDMLQIFRASVMERKRKRIATRK